MVITPTELYDTLQPFVSKIDLSQSWQGSFLKIFYRDKDYRIVMRNDDFILHFAENGAEYILCKSNRPASYVALQFITCIYEQEIFALQEELDSLTI